MKPKTVLLVAVPFALAMITFVAMTKGAPASPTAKAANKERNSTPGTTKSLRTEITAHSLRASQSHSEEDPALAGPIDEGIAPSEPPIVAAEALIADYRSEAFHSVPAWLPRPLQAERAIPEDTTLRSDGLSEGVVRYSFSNSIATHLATLQNHLLQSGFTANEAKTTFTAINPPRTCTLAVTGSQIVATYQSQGHIHTSGEVYSCGH